jgi:hypothetical protein
MANISQIVDITISNILNNDNSKQQKLNELKILHQKIISTKNIKISYLLQKIFDTVRIINSEKYNNFMTKKIDIQKKEREIENEMNGFDFIQIFSSLYEIQKDEDISHLTNKMGKLTINLKCKKKIELNKIAKLNKIKGYSKIKKNELIQLLESINNLQI